MKFIYKKVCRKVACRKVASDHGSLVVVVRKGRDDENIVRNRKEYIEYKYIFVQHDEK